MIADVLETFSWNLFLFGLYTIRVKYYLQADT
jgi:hypothetical protein